MRRIEVLSGVTVLALGFLLPVPAIRATEPPEGANDLDCGRATATESVSLCEADEILTAFLELDSPIRACGLLR
jgi:hypothetical protein